MLQSLERAKMLYVSENVAIRRTAISVTLSAQDTLGEYIECACAGIMGCSTCHVVISPEWFSSDGDETTKIGPPCEAELDMIDLAYEPEVTSRLGCQIKLTTELDGLVVLLPAGSNNLMVSRYACRWKAHAKSSPRRMTFHLNEHLPSYQSTKFKNSRDLIIKNMYIMDSLEVTVFAYLSRDDEICSLGVSWLGGFLGWAAVVVTVLGILSLASSLFSLSKDCRTYFAYGKDT